MKAASLLLILATTFAAHFAQADLRFDCPALLPLDLSVFKSVPAADPCIGQGTSVVALTQTRVLYTCENGKTLASYDISIGRGGIGKTKSGDLKTPIGTYTLSEPYTSERFGLFIPVGYPTARQRAQGMTGSEVGIHGPNRPFACAGVLNVVGNWTQGCLAVANDHFITDLSNFVRSHRNVLLHVL
jgi:lipoprotein-anchoring transpeptidase ErfK/SrfK